MIGGSEYGLSEFMVIWSDQLQISRQSSWMGCKEWSGGTTKYERSGIYERGRHSPLIILHDMQC